MMRGHALVYAVPVKLQHNVLFCETCQAETFFSNNYACGKDECCGPNLDYCTVCKVSEWPRGAD